jgi:NDP-sugar pyrophosphorylase family protein
MNVPDTAFVLGAGLGTRLKSLTARRPKPLIPVANQPLIAHAFEHLALHGVHRFVINTHWRAEAYTAAFPESSWKSQPLAWSHEHPEVLETAGGLKHAAPLLPSSDSFWVYNGDILSDIPLQRAIETHQQHNHLVTLVLRSNAEPRQIAFNPETTLITDIGNRITPDSPKDYLFTGISLINPSLLNHIPANQKISVIPIYIDLIKQGLPVGGCVINEGSWHDLGNRDTYLEAHQLLASQNCSSPWIHPTASVAPSARITGASAIGAHASIGADCLIHDSIVWENARILPEAQLHRCVVTDGAHVAGHHLDSDLTEAP